MILAEFYVKIEISDHVIDMNPACDALDELHLDDEIEKLVKMFCATR